MRAPGIYLFWIPLGAGGSGFVRLNGRVYEALVSRRARRPSLDLYHTALEVRLPGDRYVVETMWPSPDTNGSARGVTVVGPVFVEWLSSTRIFRYEVRCWRDGELPDADEAVGGAQLVAAGVDIARRVVELTPAVPVHTWGRDVIGTGDMWNSNSVISWLLASSGIEMSGVVPPSGGRAPGWDAGIAVAGEVLPGFDLEDSSRERVSSIEQLR